jgi:hypothetical protein
MFLMDLSRIKCEEAWKKRPFFPEDILNTDIRFHFGLLSRLETLDFRFQTSDHKFFVGSVSKV